MTELVGLAYHTAVFPTECYDCERPIEPGDRFHSMNGRSFNQPWNVKHCVFCISLLNSINTWERSMGDESVTAPGDLEVALVTWAVDLGVVPEKIKEAFMDQWKGCDVD